MLPESLNWIRSDGHRLEASLRRRVLAHHRPPRLLPCWFHGLWHRFVARFVRLPVIIGLEGESGPVLATCSQHRVKVSHHLAELGFVSARPHLGALEQLAAAPGVVHIWEDREVHAFLDVAVPSTDALRAVSRYTGKDITVAIVDTGIYPHPDLTGRIVGFKDLVKSRTQAYDDNGHGTHVAGCAASDGARSSGRYKGPAPGARLVGVKALNKQGSGTMSALLAGINWVVQNKETYQIRILSLSLGATAQSGCDADPLCQAVGKAWDAGIVTVIAAGNEGPEAGTISTPGINPKVITVGAMDDRGTIERPDDQLASFSSRGPTPDGLVKPDILSPGVGITSLRSPNSYLDKSQSGSRVGDWYFTLSGTSMATPIIAGICALLLEADPSLTPDQVKDRLRQTAQDWGLSANDEGAGYVDVDRALFG